jgi:hypothetical protein
VSTTQGVEVDASHFPTIEANSLVTRDRLPQLVSPWLLLFMSRPRTRRLRPQLYASRRRELIPYDIDEGTSSEDVDVRL